MRRRPEGLPSWAFDTKPILQQKEKLKKRNEAKKAQAKKEYTKRSQEKSRLSQPHFACGPKLPIPYARNWAGQGVTVGAVGAVGPGEPDIITGAVSAGTAALRATVLAFLFS